MKKITGVILVRYRRHTMTSSTMTTSSICNHIANIEYDNNQLQRLTHIHEQRAQLQLWERNCLPLYLLTRNNNSDNHNKRRRYQWRQRQTNSMMAEANVDNESGNSRRTDWLGRVCATQICLVIVKIDFVKRQNFLSPISLARIYAATSRKRLKSGSFPTVSKCQRNESWRILNSGKK